MKVGDGTTTYPNLDYMYLGASEVQNLIDASTYTLPIATTTTLGGVMIGTNITLDSNTGKISIANASTPSANGNGNYGVVRLSDSLTSTSRAYAATSNAVKRAYDEAVSASAAASQAQSTADSKLSSITISTGDSAGQIKYSVSNDGETYSTAINVDVNGLGSAAYTDSSAYATAAQGTLATNAMPKSGGTFTGNVTMGSGKTLTLSGAPTANNHAATKAYVDSAVTNGLQVADAMRFCGTLGTGGTVTSLPTSNVKKGDTYKVITNGTYASQSAKLGDMFIADRDSGGSTALTWSYIPSGDEIVTTVKVADSGVNIDGTARSGSVVLGMAAQKQVDTSISDGSESMNLPTSAAVASYVSASISDTKVSQTIASNNTNRPLLMSYSANTVTDTTTTDVVYRNNSIYANPSTGMVTATSFTATSKFIGALDGNATSATSATKLKTARTISIGGKATSTATSFNGTANISIPLDTITTDALRDGTDTLILNGSVS